MFILTKNGYKNLTKYPNYRFSCVGKVEYKGANPHIFVKFEEGVCYEVTFLNGETIVLGDKIKLLCVENYEETWIDIDAIKFGVKVVMHKTPNEIINKNKHMILPLLQDLLYRIENVGVIRKLNEDATYLDMIESWEEEDLKEYIFSLYNIGIYIHIKKCTNPPNKFILTIDSENLNYMFSNEESNEIINKMPDKAKINELKNKMNIDKERDFIKIVKSVKKIKSSFLCKKVKNHNTEDSWEYIVIEGALIKNA